MFYKWFEVPGWSVEETKIPVILLEQAILLGNVVCHFYIRLCAIP